MAGAGAKLFTDGSVLNAEQVNTYLMDQSIMRFASASARDAAFGGAGEPTLAEGMMCYLNDVNLLQSYDGTAWVVAGIPARSGMIVVSPTTVSVGSGSFSLSNGGAVTFTSVSSVSLNTVFNTTFENYKVYVTLTSPVSADCQMRMRLRTGTSDGIGSNYVYGGVISYSGSNIITSVNGGASETSFRLGDQTASGYSKLPFDFDVLSPVPSNQRTSIRANVCVPVTPQPYFGFVHGNFGQEISHDGFTLFPSTGTFSGVIRVYGYNNAV